MHIVIIPLPYISHSFSC